MNFFGTDSALINFFLENNYNGDDYTTSKYQTWGDVKGTTLEKIMLKSSYEEGANENELAPEFMDLVVSAGENWNTLDKIDTSPDADNKKNNGLDEITKAIAEQDATSDESNSLKDELVGIINKTLKAIKGDATEITSSDINVTHTAPDDSVEPKVEGKYESTAAEVLVKKVTDLKSSMDTTKPAIKLSEDDFNELKKMINEKKPLGLAIATWVNVVNVNDGKTMEIVDLDTAQRDKYAFNLKKRDTTGVDTVFGASLPPVPEGQPLKDIFHGIVKGSLTTKPSKTQLKDIEFDSRLLKAILSEDVSSNDEKTITESLYETKKNEMASMEIGKDKEGFFKLVDGRDGKKEKKHFKDAGEGLTATDKTAIADCILKGDKEGLAKCLAEKNADFYNMASDEMSKLHPKLILLIAKKMELLKKEEKLPGSNLVIKVPCPYDEWIETLNKNESKQPYVKTIRSSDGLQKYIKGVIAFLTKEKRILNESLKDSSLSSSIENEISIGDKKIKKFVYPEGMKGKLEHSKQLYGSHVIRHRGQGIEFPIHSLARNVQIGSGLKNTSGAFIQTGGSYQKDKSSEVHRQVLHKIINNLSTIGFTVKEGDIKEINKYIDQLGETENKLEKLFGIMKKFESLARSYGYDDLLRAEEIDTKSLDFSKIESEKDMKAYLYDSIKNVKSVMDQSVKLQSTMNNNLQKHVYAKLLSLDESNKTEKYEEF